MRTVVSVLTAALLASAGAVAQEPATLSGAARALSLSRTASRDAPVLELAYGPRAHATVGTEIAIVSWGRAARRWRAGLTALVAAENPDASAAAPGMAATRDVEALSLAHAMVSSGRTWELTVALGHEGAHLRREEPAVDPYRVSDIAFGGGGYFLAPDVALRQPLGAWTITTRLGDRIFTNALPAWVGQRAASNVVADFLEEGLLHAPFAEVTARGRGAGSWQPVVSLWGEGLVAHDDSAKNGLRVRLLAAPVLFATQGELWPFVAFGAGNGMGHFINRRELTLSLGVRHVLW